MTSNQIQVDHHTSYCLDFNNLYDAVGLSTAIPEDTVLRIREIYGLDCGTADAGWLVRFRRAALPQSPGIPLQYTESNACFFADTLCDGAVDVLDFQFLLNAFNQITGNCGFHPDFDIVNDGSIDVLDMQSLLNRFGETEPFQ